jgi:hypothetical protein
MMSGDADTEQLHVRVSRTAHGDAVAGKLGVVPLDDSAVTAAQFA